MAEGAKYDIVVVGAGPAGLLLSTTLARWGYKIKHVDNRAEPTPTGRADGIQPRSLDLLKNMGLKAQIMSHKPAKVYEVAFWDPTRGGIQRGGTWRSCPDFIGARYPFTTTLHQGLIERIFIADMHEHGTFVQRPWTVLDFENDGKDLDYPVRVRLGRGDAEAATESVRTKYLFGGEGGKSFIRQNLGIRFRHKDPISHVWGVMDGIVKTDFPDIKMKCTIHSNAGSIMVIPRERNMVRLYIQLASSTDDNFDPRKTASAEEVQQAAKRILTPYYIDWESLDWYSVYPIGQGLSDKYTLDERIFLGGDACHTHSPKAGQGMNTAFLDAQNLAWKIHHVEAGFCSRSVLSTYESERRYIAENLLNFDNKYAQLFSQRQPTSDEMGRVTEESNVHHKEGENLFVKIFKENCEFTSGYGVAYQPNELNWHPKGGHPASSPLFLSYPRGTRLRTGRIFINATVTRVADANAVHLEQEIPSNGSFRIYLFCGAPGSIARPQRPLQALTDFEQHATRPNTFFTAFLRKDQARVSHHERHNPHSHFITFATILAARRSDVEIDEALPCLLARYRSNVYADDIADMNVLGAPAAAHAKMGLDSGGVVIVRPDGYVGCVVKLVEGGATVEAINRYFEAFVGRKLGAASPSSNPKEMMARL